MLCPQFVPMFFITSAHLFLIDRSNWSIIFREKLSKTFCNATNSIFLSLELFYKFHSKASPKVFINFFDNKLGHYECMFGIAVMLKYQLYDYKLPICLYNKI